MNTFSKYGVEVLDDMVKERLHGQDYVLSFRSVSLSVLRSWFAVAGHTLCPKDYLKKEHFISERPEFWNPVRRVFICDKLEPSRRMRDSLMSIGSDG